jgi:hypothetical protein
LLQADSRIVLRPATVLCRHFIDCDLDHLERIYDQVGNDEYVLGEETEVCLGAPCPPLSRPDGTFWSDRRRTSRTIERLDLLEKSTTFCSVRGSTAPVVDQFLHPASVSLGQVGSAIEVGKVRPQGPDLGRWHGRAEHDLIAALTTCVSFTFLII